VQLLLRFASLHQTGNDLQEDRTTCGSEPLNQISDDWTSARETYKGNITPTDHSYDFSLPTMNASAHMLQFYCVCVLSGLGGVVSLCVCVLSDRGWLWESRQTDEHTGETSQLTAHTVLLCTRTHRPTRPRTAHHLQRSLAYTLLAASKGIGAGCYIISSHIYTIFICDHICCKQ